MRLLVLLVSVASYATTPVPGPGCNLGRLTAQAKAAAAGNSGVPLQTGRGTTEITYVDGDNHIEVFAAAHESGGDFYVKFIFKKRPDGRYDVVKHTRHENDTGVALAATLENSISNHPPVGMESIQKTNQVRLESDRFRSKLQKDFIDRHGLVFLDFEATKREVKAASDKGGSGWSDSQVLVHATNLTLHRMSAKLLAERLVAGIEFTGISRKDFMAHFEAQRECMDTTWDDAQLRYNDVIAALNSPAVFKEDIAKLKKEVLAEVEKTAKFK